MQLQRKLTASGDLRGLRANTCLFHQKTRGVFSHPAKRAVAPLPSPPPSGGSAGVRQTRPGRQTWGRVRGACRLALLSFRQRGGRGGAAPRPTPPAPLPLLLLWDGTAVPHAPRAPARTQRQARPPSWSIWFHFSPSSREGGTSIFFLTRFAQRKVACGRGGPKITAVL